MSPSQFLAILLAHLLAPSFVRKLSGDKKNFVEKGDRLIYAGREEDNTSLRTLADPLTFGSTIASGFFYLFLGVSISSFLIGVSIWQREWFLLLFLITGFPPMVTGFRILLSTVKDKKAQLMTGEGIVVEKSMPKQQKSIAGQLFGFMPPGPVMKLENGITISIYGISEKIQVGDRVRVSYTPHLKYWREVKVLS